MIFELEHFRTKLGRKIVSLFFLCALIPTATLAMLSYVRVRAELRSQTQERLHQGTTDAAMGVYERVQAIESEMFFLSASTLALAPAIRSGVDSPLQRSDLRRLDEMSLVSGDDPTPMPLVGSLTQVPELSSAAQAGVDRGETVLTVVSDEETTGLRILIARPWNRNDVSNGVLWARIIADSLWSTARVYGTGVAADEIDTQDEKGYCVLDPEMRPLDCGGSLAAWMAAGPPPDVLIHEDSIHGAASWVMDGRKFTGHYRRVYLRDFNSPNWTILAGESAETNLATLGDFRRNLIGFLVVTLAVVLLLAAVLIRQNMEPLAKLQEGTRRLAAKDFDTRVPVSSGDEFEDLAGSFNDMARQVGDLVSELDELNWSAITALARTIDAKSPWTAGHSERVSRMAMQIGETMGLAGGDLERLHRGGLLHDIGKIGVPVDVLDKRGRLTEEEMKIMESHVTIGARIVEPLKPLADVLPIVLHHHERFDGRGYPEGLTGTEIPYLARVLAVADTFDALRSDRPYRTASNVSDSVAIIVENSGSQLDPHAVEAFLEVMKSGDATLLTMPVFEAKVSAVNLFGSP